MSNNEQKKSVLEFIKTYWVILMFIIGIITTWVNFKNTDVLALERLDKLEAKTLLIDKAQFDISIQLSQIQNDLQWIKLRLK